MLYPVWEDTCGCRKHYSCALDIYLMSVMPYLYGNIIDCEKNTTGHGKNIVDGLNATDKRYLRKQMEIIGKLTSNDIYIIIMINSASKDVYINFAEQRVNILTYNDWLNVLKGSTKI